jgi:hypothetical protein
MTHMHIVHKLLQAFEVVRTRNTSGGAGASWVRANAFAGAQREACAGVRADRAARMTCSGMMHAALLTAAATSGLTGRAWGQATTQFVGWGYNAYDQINTPSNLSGVTQFACGGYHTYALKNDGTLVGWGNNGNGQINTPSTATNVTQVACGWYHTYALKNDGTLVGWGFMDSYGPASSATPSNLTNVTQVACGYGHTYALKNNGTLVGWGYNNSGQINTPSTATNVTQVACGYNHTYALKNDGTLVGWGANGDGQINAPSTATNVTQVACGDFHTYALKNDGTLVGWGSNYYGQLNTPSNATGVTQVACGYYHTYALKNDGTPVGWGANWSGQINTPSILTGVTQIACGYGHTYALRAWRDCNTNGTFDGDDIAYGGLADLNHDGILDSCSQGAVEYHQTSPNLGVPTANVSVNHTFTLQAPADVDVVLSVRAVGDFDANTEYLTVKLNGTTAGRLFEVGGVNCSTGNANNGNINIPLSKFNSFVAGGSLTVTLLPSPAVTGSECGNGSMSVSLNYVGIGATGDCNANGRLDTREIGENPVLDRDRSARLDACEISEDPSRDCNANGEIDSYDIMLGAADDNLNGRVDLCEYAKGDFDLDGEVTTADLSVALLYIGEVDSPIGDLDDDGTVTTADVSLLLLNFGPVTWP